MVGQIDVEGKKVGLGAGASNVIITNEWKKLAIYIQKAEMQSSGDVPPMRMSSAFWTKRCFFFILHGPKKGSQSNHYNLPNFLFPK